MSGSLLLAALLLFAVPASANGRFPASGQILVDPADSSNLLLRATFGLLTSKDGGKTAGWVCEQAIGYAGQEDPMMARAGDGALLAGLYEGLSISRDGGCSWAFAGGPLAGLSIIDLSARASGDQAVLVLAAAPSGPMAGVGQVLRSADHAETFTPLKGALPADFLPLTVDGAPSSPEVIYVSGRFGKPDYQGSLLRSGNGGESWERLDIPGALDRLPYIAAIAPDDPQKVYVRIDEPGGDTLVMTGDGGKSFDMIFQGTGDLLAFALSPDGSELAVGGDKDGLHHATAASLTFTKVSSITARCAAWAKDGLYVCADQLLDGFAMGFSTDGGATLAPKMLLTAACAPLDCPAGTSVGTDCPAAWPATAKKLNAPDCTPDGGSSASSAESSSSGGTSGGGCGCMLTRDAGSTALSIVTSVMWALAIGWRRALFLTQSRKGAKAQKRKKN